MIKLNIHEAKTHLSHYLDEARKGEKVLICKRNRPVAELRPLVERPKAARPIGLARGTFTVPPAFFDELPDEIIRAFAGEEA